MAAPSAGKRRSAPGGWIAPGGYDVLYSVGNPVERTSVSSGSNLLVRLHRRRPGPLLSEGDHAVESRAVALQAPQVHVGELHRRHLTGLDKVAQVGDGPESRCLQVSGPPDPDPAHPDWRRCRIQGEARHPGIKMEGEGHVVSQGLLADLLVTLQACPDSLHHGPGLFWGDLEARHPGGVQDHLRRNLRDIGLLDLGPEEAREEGARDVSERNQTTWNENPRCACARTQGVNKSLSVQVLRSGVLTVRPLRHAARHVTSVLVQHLQKLLYGVFRLLGGRNPACTGVRDRTGIRTDGLRGRPGE